MSTTTQKPSFTMPPMSAEHQATAHVASRLCEMIREHRNLDAIRELYADNARHVEVMGGPGCDRIMEGKPALLQKAEQFGKSITVHDSSIGKPRVNGDQFVVDMMLDCTSHDGPMKGMRMKMEETALYTVKHGKISEGKFFYSCEM